MITFLPEDEYDTRPTQFIYQHDRFVRDQVLQSDVLEELACNPNPLPALQSLDINTWFALHYSLYRAAPFKWIVASLQDLRFTVQDIEYRPDCPNEIGHDFWTYVIGLFVLQPAVNLTSLAMESSVSCGSLIRLDLGSITLLCLTLLSLSCFAWDDTRLDPQKVTLEAEDSLCVMKRPSRISHCGTAQLLFHIMRPRQSVPGWPPGTVLLMSLPSWWT